MLNELATSQQYFQVHPAIRLAGRAARFAPGDPSTVRIRSGSARRTRVPSPANRLAPVQPTTRSEPVRVVAQLFRGQWTCYKQTCAFDRRARQSLGQLLASASIVTRCWPVITAIHLPVPCRSRSEFASNPRHTSSRHMSFQLDHRNPTFPGDTRSEISQLQSQSPRV